MQFKLPRWLSRQRTTVQAKYDVAQTTDENKRHWANADGLSADAAASPHVRQTVRNRSRYEVANNSFASGMLSTRANDLIGRGPRVSFGSDDPRLNRDVQQTWRKWSTEIDLAQKLRTACQAVDRDGEVFLQLVTNPAHDHRIKLDIKVIEADRVTDPTLTPQDKNHVDGIRYDEYGNPVEYSVLKEHPGSNAFGLTSGMFAYERVPASQMIHLKNVDRPEQQRGLPVIMPALPLFALLRRYTLAVVTAAETAANFAGVMKTDGPAVEPADVEPMDVIPLERNMFTTMPEGWDIHQLKAEQPTTTYEMFRNAILNEIARCLNMPFNVAAGNSAGYNYASGRLDHQVYFKALQVIQAYVESAALDRIFKAFVYEARLVNLFEVELVDAPPYRWFWDVQKHVDPKKEADAVISLWETGHLSDDEILFMRGMDPDEHHKNLLKQKERRRELGLPLPGGQQSQEADTGQAA